MVLPVLLQQNLCSNLITAQGWSKQLHLPKHPAAEPAGTLGNGRNFSEHPCVEHRLENKQSYSRAKCQSGLGGLSLNIAISCLERDVLNEYDPNCMHTSK